MSEEIFLTAKTVEEAMAEAREKYSDREFSIDIVEMPKKGFLGIGASPAKIKITFQVEEADLGSIVNELKDMKLTTDKGGDGSFTRQSKPQNQPRPEKPQVKEKPAAQSKPQPAPKANSPKAQEAPKVRPAEQIKPEAKPEVKPEVAVSEQILTNKAAAPIASREDKSEIIVTDEELAVACDFANQILKNMCVKASAAVVGEGADRKIDISGEDAGALIGHHGETLDAFQYLVNIAVMRNQKTESASKREFVKIIVDIENYRSKREETLRQLARRMAGKAVKYKRNILLEPMNPYERRIIHSEIQNIENVSTHSVGSDENRKIIITYEGADKVHRGRPSSRGAAQEK